MATVSNPSSGAGAIILSACHPSVMPRASWMPRTIKVGVMATILRSMPVRTRTNHRIPRPKPDAYTIEGGHR